MTMDFMAKNIDFMYELVFLLLVFAFLSAGIGILIVKIREHYKK